MILEKNIQSKIISILTQNGWDVVKTLRLSKAGYPDIFAFKNGKTLFIEVKSEKGKLSELQKYRIDSLKNNGFEVLIIKSVNELQATQILKEIK